MQNNNLNEILDSMFSEVDLEISNSASSNGIIQHQSKTLLDTAQVELMPKTLATETQEPNLLYDILAFLPQIELLSGMVETIDCTEEASNSSTESMDSSPSSLNSPIDYSVSMHGSNSALAEVSNKSTIKRKQKGSSKIEKPTKLFRKYKGSEKWKEEMFNRLADLKTLPEVQTRPTSTKKTIYCHLQSHFPSRG